MEMKKRKKLVVVGILFIFLGISLAPGIYAYTHNNALVRRVNQQTLQKQCNLQEDNTIKLHIFTSLGPIITRTATLEDEKKYEKIQETMEEINMIASTYKGNTHTWLNDMGKSIDSLLTQLQEIGLIKNENDKQMIKNQITGRLETQIDETWEQFNNNDNSFNNSLCLIAGYGTQYTHMEFPLRNPFYLSIARTVLAVMEFVLKYDFELVSQILNYLSSDHILNLALYCQFIVDENRTMKPPWVGVFTYGQNGYQATVNNSNATLLGYAGLVVEFYFGLGSLYVLDATGIVGFAAHAQIEQRPT
jgi:hypothetical protein